MGSVETYPKIFEKEGHGSHLPGAAMPERDESMKCKYCNNPAARWYKAALFPNLDPTDYSCALCDKCDHPSDPDGRILIWVKITQEEFIAFQVMHS
jgi:hypothetical protein